MAFFASRKPQAGLAESASPGDQQLVAPGSMGAKALGALGINTAMIEQMGDDVSRLLTDYKERLHRIETKLDLLGADYAELIELLRLKKEGQPTHGRDGLI